MVEGYHGSQIIVERRGSVRNEKQGARGFAAV